MPPSKTAKKTPAKKAARPTQARTRQPVEETPVVPPTPIHAPDPAGQNAKYAPTTWGSSDSTAPIDLECPSGQLCLVKRPGVEGLLTAGVLHNVDRLSAIVGKKHLQGHKTKGGKARKDDEVDAMKLMSDPEKLAEITHTVDRVVCHVVVQPPIHMTPGDVTRRKDGVIYADMVDLMDKMFIFNFVVGGSSDLESFRGGLAGAVGGVDALEDVQGSTG